ncbi:DUF2480 family protein, partial [Staphylococcus aureus]|nr:DUF2480 family protein [Staphylococcus aureus]
MREKDFRQMISDLDTEPYKDCYVYIYCSVDAIVPLWAYFLLGDKLMSSAKKAVYGSQKELELILFHDAIQQHDFSEMQD